MVKLFPSRKWDWPDQFSCLYSDRQYVTKFKPFPASPLNPPCQSDSEFAGATLWLNWCMCLSAFAGTVYGAALRR